MKIETLVSGLSFTECPRWHNGRLWYSDFYTCAVYSVDNVGNNRVELQLDDQPAGLGWMPNGDLRVVSQIKKKLLGYDGATIYEVADLSSLANGNCNDMVVASDGGAYIGNFGFDFHAPEFRPAPATLVYVSSTGEISVAAEEMCFPNGSVILDSGKTDVNKTLVVAESMGHCLTAFSIANDGTLSDRRIWANLGRPMQDDYTMANFNLDAIPLGAITPDGIAADAEGGIWVATVKNELLRVIEDGEITQRIEFDQAVIACAVGDDGSLYVCTTAHLTPSECLKYRSARIDRVVFRG